MKAVIVKKTGGPEVLQVTTVPTPALKPGWSRIKVMGFGINHSEIFTRQGLSPSVKFPRILGIEAVGLIDATTSASPFTVGQKVVSIMGEMGRDFDGSYAEYVLIPDTQIYPVTTNLPWQQMAAVPETYYTAAGIIAGLRITAGDTVLVRAATSGVGVAVLKLLAVHPDVTLVATTRSAAKTQLLQQSGADRVLVTPDAKHLPTTTKFDKIVDLIGPLTVKDSLTHLNEGGIVSSTGQLGGMWTLPDFDPIMAIPNNCYLTSFYSGEVQQQTLQAVFTTIERHQIDVSPQKVFLFPQVAAAHEYLAHSHSFGKVVVLMQ